MSVAELIPISVSVETRQTGAAGTRCVGCGTDTGLDDVVKPPVNGRWTGVARVSDGLHGIIQHLVS